MIQTLVASVMWLLATSVLVLRRRRTDRSITYASITIAVAMTLNIDSVYRGLDPLFGGTNAVTLFSDVLLMIALLFLGRGAVKAGAYRPGLVKVAVGTPALVIALMGVASMFWFIDRGQTTTEFMSDLGAQPAAAMYSITVFTYCGIVVTALLVLAGRRFRIFMSFQRIPAALLALGSLCGMALCVTVLILDITHVAGALDAMRAVEPLYGPLTLMTFLLLCAGFIAQPAARLVRRRLRAVCTDVLLAQLESPWREATTVRPGLSENQLPPEFFEEPEAKLHRRVVEIRDAMIDPRITFPVSAKELELLERAERHLLGSNGQANTSDTEPR